jgi:hypothetical protein
MRKTRCEFTPKATEGVDLLQIIEVRFLIHPSDEEVFLENHVRKSD